MNKNTHYDVIVIGGGMVGAVCATTLADEGFLVAVIEGRQPATEWTTDYDVRVSAITRGSQNILTSINAWSAIEAIRAQPFRDMNVWDSGGDGEIRFESADIGEPYLGHIVENRVIQRTLWQRLEQHENISLFCPHIPDSVTISANHATVRLENNQQLSSELLVGADGGRSWLRQNMNIETSHGSYGQVAIVATVKSENSHQETAWQRFLPTGPLAFLPLSDGYSSIVWSTSKIMAEQLMAESVDSFCTNLTKAFDNKLGKIEKIVGERATFPLSYMHAKQYVQQRVALIGDAAHTIHPLAGQGVNLGFADAAALSEILSEARFAKRSIGAYATLRKYERWRRGENTVMLNSMTAFKHLFGNENSWFKTVRNIGLNLTHQSGPVKNHIIRLAMGLTGDLPSRARGII